MPVSHAMLGKNRASLSPARRWLLEKCQHLNFGRIENLEIQDGQPVLNPLPRLIREVKFGGENSPRPELGIADFQLKSQVVDLFAFFDELQTGTIEVIELKHGLPFRMVVVEESA
jgi:hypothetical protein